MSKFAHHWEIIRLAAPNIVSNITVPFISSVDTFLMGQVSTAHLGAVGIGSMLFNFLFWNFGFLRMSTTGLTAQAFGREDTVAQGHQLMRGVALALAIGSVLLLLQKMLLDLGVVAFGVHENQVDLVRTYFSYRIWGAPAALLLYVGMGWFFGLQNPWYPLLVTVLVNVINIGSSYYFVAAAGMGIKGVAIGTLIAEYVGVLLVFLLIAYRYRSLLVNWRSAFESLEPIKAFLKINTDIFIRTFSLTFAFAFFNRQSSLAGPIVLATNTVLLQFLNWMSYFIDGFAYAAESLVGKYVGRQDSNRGQIIVRAIFVWGMVLAVAFSLVYGFGGSLLLDLFSDDPLVLEYGEKVLPWMIALPIIGTPCYLWDGIFIGLTASKALRNSMIGALIVYLVVFLLSTGLLGTGALWLSLLTFLGARGVFQWILWRRSGWQLK